MHGRVNWGMAVAAVLVTVVSAGCAGGSGRTLLAPAPGGTSGSAAGASPSAAGRVPVPVVASTSSRPTTAIPSRIKTAAPDATGPVRGYYGAVAAHDAQAARQFLAPEYLASFGSEGAFSAWVSNYRSLTDLTLGAARAPSADVPAQHPGYRELTVIPISYVALLRKPSANETNGPQDRFVLVGRAAESGKWLIVDIATSP